MRRDESIRWTKEKASREFGIDAKTLTGRMRRAGIVPGDDSRFSTAQICAAVFGDIDGEKLRLVREQADKLEIENAESRKELIPIKPLADTLNRALGAIKAKIQGTIRLEQKERDEICAICARAYGAAFEASGSDDADASAAPAPDGERVG